MEQNIESYIEKSKKLDNSLTEIHHMDHFSREDVIGHLFKYTPVEEAIAIKEFVSQSWKKGEAKFKNQFPILRSYVNEVIVKNK